MNPLSPPENGGGEGAPKWTVTFADLMSLLLCFFVLLLSFSEMDRAVYKQVAGSLEKAFGVQRKTKTMDPPKGVSFIAKDFDQELVPALDRIEFIASQLREAIHQELKKLGNEMNEELEGLVQVEAGDDQITIRFMGESTFDSGRAEIRQAMLPVLLKVATVLNERPNDIIVAGHTDNVPIKSGRFHNNLDLSIARAASVANFLLERCGVLPSRISTMGFGQYRPLATNATAEGRQKNRRVEIILSNLDVNRRKDKIFK
jgi:chemotaxis protein MotB